MHSFTKTNKMMGSNTIILSLDCFQLSDDVDNNVKTGQVIVSRSGNYLFVLTDFKDLLLAYKSKW